MIVRYVRETYNDVIDEDQLQFEVAVLQTMFQNVKVTYFYDIYQWAKEIGNPVKQLILNIKIP